MTNPLEKYFGVAQPVIGMVHFPPLPGSPLYDGRGVEDILEGVRRDLLILQEEGINAVMFGNEGDRPYQFHADMASPCMIAYAIGRLKQEIRVPFGVDILFDPHATIALAKATGAIFAREVFTNVYGSDMGLWSTNPAEHLRYGRSLGVENLLLLYNINAEFALPLAPRPIEAVARSAVFSCLAKVLCVSGPITGDETSTEDLRKVKAAVGQDAAVFANTGVNIRNVREKLSVADGVVIGTSLKKDGVTWNSIDRERVRQFMAVVKEIQRG
jgi:uncharacterized protein